MKYKLRYLPLALEDLESISEYLKMFYPNTLSAFISELEKKAAALGEFPLMYEPYELNPFYRRMLIDNYSLFYHINEENNTIDVHRVLRTSWEVKRFLSQNT